MRKITSIDGSFVSLLGMSNEPFPVDTEKYLKAYRTIQSRATPAHPVKIEELELSNLEVKHASQEGMIEIGFNQTLLIIRLLPRAENLLRDIDGKNAAQHAESTRKEDYKWQMKTAVISVTIGAIIGSILTIVGQFLLSD